MEAPGNGLLSLCNFEDQSVWYVWWPNSFQVGLKTKQCNFIFMENRDSKAQDSYLWWTEAYIFSMFPKCDDLSFRLVASGDQTEILRAGYWPSYNVPFYEEVSSTKRRSYKWSKFTLPFTVERICLMPRQWLLECSQAHSWLLHLPLPLPIPDRDTSQGDFKCPFKCGREKGGGGGGHRFFTPPMLGCTFTIAAFAVC